MASHYAPRKARFGPLKKIVLGILQFVLGLAVLLAALWGIFTLIAKHQSFVESYYQVQSDKLTSTSGSFSCPICICMSSATTMRI